MVAQDFIAQTEPTDIVAELSLSIGTAYSCQNVSTFATLRIREEIATPDRDRGGVPRRGRRFVPAHAGGWNPYLGLER